MCMRTITKEYDLSYPNLILTFSLKYFRSSLGWFFFCFRLSVTDRQNIPLGKVNVQVWSNLHQVLYPLVFIASQSSSHDLGPRGSLTHCSQTSVGLEHMFSDSSIPGQKEIETSHGLSTKPNNVSLERVCVFVCWLFQWVLPTSNASYRVQSLFLPLTCSFLRTRSCLWDQLL